MKLDERMAGGGDMVAGRARGPGDGEHERGDFRRQGQLVRAGVTTPAGTTAAGLEALEERGFRSALAAAVKAATIRSAELGKPSNLAKR